MSEATNIDADNKLKIGLILSGGGARAAYQVGVMKAIAEIQGRRASNPFSVFSGTSAGAINAVAIAASSNNFMLAVKKLEKMWSDLKIENVFRSRARDLLKNISQIVVSLFSARLIKDRPISFLNNDPLRILLQKNIQYKNIQKRIDAGHLDAVCVTASGYESGESVTFFQAHEDVLKWRSPKRTGFPTEINVQHLLASSAIPTILPAEKISREYFGDGALRQLSPISPALKLGAQKILVIGAKASLLPSFISSRIKMKPPTLAKMIGHVLDSAFIDSLEYDISMTRRQNDLIQNIDRNNLTTLRGKKLKHVDLLVIRPSKEFNEFTPKHIKRLTFPMKSLMRILGAHKSDSVMGSFLLFEGAFCKELIELGYEDAMNRKEDLKEFLEIEQASE
jgi:NTE family protein